MATCWANSPRVKPNTVRSTRSPAKSVITASPDVSLNTNRSIPGPPGPPVKRFSPGPACSVSSPSPPRSVSARPPPALWSSPRACRRSGSPRRRRRASRRHPTRPRPGRPQSCPCPHRQPHRPHPAQVAGALPAEQHVVARLSEQIVGALPAGGCVPGAAAEDPVDPAPARCRRSRTSTVVGAWPARMRGQAGSTLLEGSFDGPVSASEFMRYLSDAHTEGV